MFDEGMDWNAYFRELWTGEVSAQTLDQFQEKYQGSEEERADLLEAYKTTKGSLPSIIDHVPFLSLRNDRSRIERTIEEAISAKEVTRLKLWDKTRKDEVLLSKAEKKEAAEEEEAKEMAKEMGVYDDLFGAQKKTTKESHGKKRKSESKDPKDDDEDIAALQSLIAKRNQGRGTQMDNLIAKLEAEATEKATKKGKKAKPPPMMPGQERLPGEPSEEEFAKAQARMEKRRAKQAKV